MLIMLLIYAYKKIFKNSNFVDRIAAFSRIGFKIKYIIPFFLLSMSSSDKEVPKVEKVSFSIIKKNSTIGYIDIEKQSLNETTTYIINSEVNAKVIFNFNAIGKEKSIYKKDTLIYSSIYRKLNNKVKLNQSLSFINGKYLLKEENKNELLNIDIINRNLVTLFFNEPNGIQEIYTDKYKQMVKIDPIGDRKYKLILPNKSINIYHYENGKCTTIDVVGSFFKVKLILNIKNYQKN